MAVEDDENPEENHPPKGKRGRPSNNPKFEKKYQEGNCYEVGDQTPQNKNKSPTHGTEKDENRTRTHWRKATRIYLVDQLAKQGWKWPKTPEGKNTKSLNRN